MNIREIKQKIDLYGDALYQKGYELGFESLLEEFEQIADKWHNNGVTTGAELLRLEIKRIRSED